MSQQLLFACLLISAVIGAAVAIIKAGAWLWRGIRKLVRLADDLTGEPAYGITPARPGVLDRLAGIEERLSLLDGIEVRLAAVEARFPIAAAAVAAAAERVES